MAGEESAGPINCLTLDSDGIFVGVGGVNGLLVGVVGRLPCRPRAGVVSLSLSLHLSLSLCRTLSFCLSLSRSPSRSLSLLLSFNHVALPRRRAGRSCGGLGPSASPSMRAPPSSADTYAVRCRAGIGFSNA